MPTVGALVGQPLGMLEEGRVAHAERDRREASRRFRLLDDPPQLPGVEAHRLLHDEWHAPVQEVVSRPPHRVVPPQRQYEVGLHLVEHPVVAGEDRDAASYLGGAVRGDILLLVVDPDDIHVVHRRQVAEVG